MDYALPAPNTLGDIFNQNPGAFTQAQGLIDTGQQFADQSFQRNDLANQQSAAMNPLLQQHQQGINAAQDAQLPGLVASSSMLQRKNNNQSLLNDSEIADTLGKYKEAEQDRHIKEVNGMGTTLQQLGSQVWDNPIGAAARSKEALAKAGHAEMWNPSWDNLPPQELAAAMNDAGVSIANTGEKMQAMRMQMQQKKTMAEDLEDQKQAGRMALRDKINAAAEAIEQSKEEGKTKNNKYNYQQAATQYNALADRAQAAGDSQKAQELYAKANDYTKLDREARSAGANVTTDVKPNMKQFGIGTNADNSSPPTTLGPPGQVAPPQNVPAAKVPGATRDIPAAAMSYLMQHPDTADHFEQMYGPGTAKALLSGNPNVKAN